MAEVVAGAVEAVRPEGRRLQLAVEGAEGDHGNLIGNVMRRNVLSCRQTHVSVRPSGRWRRLVSRGWWHCAGGACPSPRGG